MTAAEHRSCHNTRPSWSVRLIACWGFWLRFWCTSTIQQHVITFAICTCHQICCRSLVMTMTWYCVQGESKNNLYSFYYSVYICWRISTIFVTEYIEAMSNTEVIDLPPYPLIVVDVAPAHIARITQNWLQANCPGFIEKNRWPPNSPVLNPLDYHICTAMLEKYHKLSQNPRRLMSWKSLCKQSGKSCHKNTSTSGSKLHQTLDCLPMEVTSIICSRL